MVRVALGRGAGGVTWGGIERVLLCKVSLCIEPCEEVKFEEAPTFADG